MRKTTKTTGRKNRPNDKEEKKLWPAAWIRFLLWPIADFNWREKVEMRLATSQYTLVEMLSLEPAFSIQPVPNLPLFLLPDGSIRFEEPQFKAPDRTRRENHSVPFTIDLSPEVMAEEYRLRPNYPPMKGPIVSSDGWYVKTFRREGEQLDKVFTFEEGLWFRWQENEGESSYSSILLAGLRNYQALGEKSLVRTLIAAVMLLVIVSLLTPDALP